MSNIQLSPEQRSAVENRGGTLLVSAAAGSGKTRVLVERLFRYIIEERRNVDDFLVITFTRAAASELRGRIVEELNRRLAVTPEDTHLQKQLMRVYRAEIKTIDAFCSSLIRENVHLLAEDRRGNRLAADFRILDENEAELLRQRALERVLEEYYDACENGGSTLLADTFGYGRSDSGLAAVILDLYNKIQSHAYPLRWLEESERQWSALPADLGESAYAKELLERLRRKADYWVKQLCAERERLWEIAPLRKGYGPAFDSLIAQVRALCEIAAAGRWDDIGAFQLEFIRLSPVKSEEVTLEKERAQSVRKRCKKELGDALEIFHIPLADYAADLRAIAPAIRDLLRLTREFALRAREEKTRRNTADFSDQEHDAVQLLLTEEGEPTELGRTVSARYTEIMVDEYQDTNEVQNCIFSAVSKEGENLFVVGDVKQSIYRFRLADPGIFLRHYAAYKPVDKAAAHEPRKLLLSKNYRSRAEVVDAVNFVFENILSPDMGEMEYGEEERLYAGNESFPPRADCAPEFHLITLPRRQEEERKLARTDAEARFVAARIARMLRERFPVQGEDGMPRPLREEDVAILMRSPSSRLKAFRQALGEQGIRCCVESVGGFFESVEIAVTFQLLQIIDNPRQDVPLISVLSSPLFGFTPDRLAEIRAASPSGDFYAALSVFDGADARAFLEKLGALRAQAKDLSVVELLSRLYDEWNLCGIFGAMEGGSERRENLSALLEHARRFEAAGYQGLFAFTAELRQMLERGEAPATQLQSGSDGVRIMSIHKSKGLEFPVVFLCDLAHQFNKQDFSAPVLVHPALGLGPLFIDLTRRIKYPTLARQALESRMLREMKAEEMRILYVAMTRAKEKLILVHCAAGAEKRLETLQPMAACPADPETLDVCACMGEWILLPLLCRMEAAPLRELSGYGITGICLDGRTPWQVETHDGMRYQRVLHPADMPTEEAERAEDQAQEQPFSPALLEFSYPYAHDVALPTVVSATQLKHRAPEAETAELRAFAPHLRGMAEPAFLRGETALTGAESGTATHLLMEHLDFSCEPTEAGVERELQRLTAEGKLTPRQSEAVRRSEVAALLRSPLGQELREARLNREYRLSILVSARLYDPAASEDAKILLHGVVDCWYALDDGRIAVVDFKTDRVRGEGLARRAEEYRPQVEAYCDALRRILGREIGKKALYFFSENKAVLL